jgi:hypothetical protein
MCFAFDAGFVGDRADDVARQDTVLVADFDAIRLASARCRRCRAAPSGLSDSGFCVRNSGVVPWTMLASAAAISIAGTLPSVSSCSRIERNSCPAPTTRPPVIFFLELHDA